MPKIGRGVRSTTSLPWLAADRTSGCGQPCEPAATGDSRGGDMSKVQKTVLFHRDFRAFTGGHRKVWNYFNHIAAAPGYEAKVACTARSKWDRTNPWIEARDRVVDWHPDKADIL